MNALRNIFTNRALNYLRQNGPNAIINLTQPSVEANASPTNNDTNNNITSPSSPLNGKPHLKPLLIPRSILDVTEFFGKNISSNVQRPPTTTPTSGSSSSGSLSPTTLKRCRHMARKMELVYRCKLCNTRNKKLITEAAYKTGIVIIQCEGCAVNHLIVDNLGWFANTKGKSFDQVLAERHGGNERIQVIRVNEKGDLI